MNNFKVPDIDLKELRKKKGLSQKELAKACGVHQPHICAIETGKRSVGKEVAKRLGSFFDVDYRLFL